MSGTLVLIVGVAIIFATLFQLLKNHIKKHGDAFDKEFENILKYAELVGSVKYRMKQVDELTNTQNDLSAHVLRPNASAAHSKWKNDLIGQLKDLERLKINIFRSIVADGLDPLLMMGVEGNGEPKLVKMSEAIALFDSEKGHYNLPAPDPKTESKSSQKSLRLVVDNTEEKIDESGSPKVP